MLPLSKILGLAGMLGFLISLIILGVVALRDGSFLYRSYGSKMVFRKRLTSRVHLAMMGLFMAVGGPVVHWYRLTEASGPPISKIAFIGLWAIFAGLFFATGILLVRLSGPEDLYLDLDHHTYRLISGWPLFPTTRSGDWSDIAGIYTKSAGTSGTIVGVSWRFSEKQKTPLGRFERKGSAEQFAQEMSFKLELPQIAVQK